MEERLPRKLAVILHADVVGYSRLAGEDEDDTHIRLQESLNLISRSAITVWVEDDVNRSQVLSGE